MSTKRFFLLVILIAGLPCASLAKDGAASVEELIELVKTHFLAGDVEKFSNVFEVAEGQKFLRESIDEKLNRTFDVGKILSKEDNEATLLLAGKFEDSNSGDTTIISNIYFSGIYLATREGKGWKVKRRLSYDKNLINSQKLNVEILPGNSIRVKDKISITVYQGIGFAVGLNHLAKISRIRLDGMAVNYEFGGGLLWVDVLNKGKGILDIEYEIEVDRDLKSRNSGYWGKDFGHVRNQFYWHPFFGFSSDADKATFEIQARIPEEFKLVTSIPQTERLENGVRIVSGKSVGKVKMLTLLYDKDWTVTRKKIDSRVFEVFATKDFSPSIASLEAGFETTYNELKRRFGKPVSNYYAIAQSRGRGGGGWHYRSNELIAAGKNGGKMIWNKPFPRAPFAHEVAHAWTNPTGAGANFLQEGWASFAEAIFIKAKYGQQAKKRYFEKYREIYKQRKFDGNAIILDDPTNGGVAYYKGAWIFRMLQDFIGERKFRKGMTRYIKKSRKGRADIDSFVDSFASVSRKDVRSFLRPWLNENVIPKVSGILVGKTFELRQKGPLFLLPIEIDFETQTGTFRKSYLIKNRSAKIDISSIGKIRSFKIDPDDRLMLNKNG